MKTNLPNQTPDGRPIVGHEMVSKGRESFLRYALWLVAKKSGKIVLPLQEIMDSDDSAPLAIYFEGESIVLEALDSPVDPSLN